jgi:hypothetical protein
MGEKLSIEQLRKEQAYLNLTDPQRRLVEVFLQTGNKLNAVQAAYKCKSEQTARVMVYSYFANPRIIVALAVANGGDPEREKFNAELERAIRNPKTTRNQVSALRMKAQLNGYLGTVPEPLNENEPQKFPIGAIIIQSGKKYRVVAEELE